MKLLLLAVGRPRSPTLRAAIAEYEARAARYFSLEVFEVAAGGRRTMSPEEVREKEGRTLLDRLPREYTTFALSRDGIAVGSRGLAARLEEIATYGRSGAAFIVGGAFGLSPAVLAAADFRLSLSAMTLPHELARLILAEQVYRVGTLIRGESYHKGG